MKEIIVHLDDEDELNLRIMAARTGRSEDELITEGLHHVFKEMPPTVFRSAGKDADSTEACDQKTRRFSSAGVGEYTGDLPPRWTADELYAWVFPDRVDRS